ncbi:MAG: ISNCY family transposase [Dehalococcoidia bacterium]
MNKKEQRRLMILNKLEHGNRGREPVHALCDEIRNRIVDLVQRKYTGFNQQHFTEMLIEREGISVSRSTVRRILSNAGIHSPRRRRPPKHRKRRDRYPQEGMMLQIDGSPHDWLEERGPKLSMIAAIDDATGKVAGALFREQEDAQGYFLLLKQIVAAHGIPVALYHDRHGIFERYPLNKESIDEQLEGKRALTQFGRLMQELGVTSIAAMSPQAKGRIERLWGTFQDRLVSELRLAGVSTLDEANSMLEGFLQLITGGSPFLLFKLGAPTVNLVQGLSRMMYFASNTGVRSPGIMLSASPTRGCRYFLQTAGPAMHTPMSTCMNIWMVFYQSIIRGNVS